MRHRHVVQDTKIRQDGYNDGEQPRGNNRFFA